MECYEGFERCSSDVFQKLWLLMVVFGSGLSETCYPWLV